MKKHEFKKMLAGVGIAGLLSGAGIGLSASSAIGASG